MPKDEKTRASSKRREVIWRQVPQATLALGKYALLLVYDLVISGIKVARIVLDPALPINPGIVAIQSKCRSESATALNAHALTITPGESVVEMSEDGVMYTHCLDTSHTEDYIVGAQEMRRDLLDKIIP